MQLSIIIVNYNVKFFLEQCLHAAQKACQGLEAEIIVVDNASTDGSRAYLEPLFPQVRFYWLPENIGFAKANNHALVEARGNYILFLNPDTIVPEDCFSSCISYLQEQDNSGALGIRMINGSGEYLRESKRGFPSLSSSFFKLSGFARLFPHSRLLAGYYMAHLPENKNAPVDVLAGAYMMIPKKILDEVGSFDERFFMYGEDVDLSYRIQKAGYRNFYFAQNTIIHFKGESTSRQQDAYVQVFYDAMKLFVQKHYSPARAGLYSLFISAAKGLKKLSRFLKPRIAAQGHTPDAIRIIIGDSQKPSGNTHVKSIAELNAILSTYPNAELIFCEGTISFKEIILAIEKWGRQHNCMIHASGSHSMVSSNNQRMQGLAVSL